MSNQLVIVAHIKAHPDKIELVQAELNKLIGPTRKEVGCVQYDLHQDNEDSSKFLFYEIWETPETWHCHMDNQHLKDFKTATEGAIEELFVQQMTHVG